MQRTNGKTWKKMCIRDRSELARKEKNHFGIKATQSWIAEGGRYKLYSDDKPNEKFCSYDNVGDSYEHHSRFLKENSRYADPHASIFYREQSSQNYPM